LCGSFHTTLQARLVESPSINRSKLSGIPNVLPTQRPAPATDISMTVHLMGGRLDATMIIAGCWLELRACLRTAIDGFGLSVFEAPIGKSSGARPPRYYQKRFLQPRRALFSKVGHGENQNGPLVFDPIGKGASTDVAAQVRASCWPSLRVTGKPTRSNFVPIKQFCSN
jgi:hypothetical protein